MEVIKMGAEYLNNSYMNMFNNGTLDLSSYCSGMSSYSMSGLSNCFSGTGLWSGLSNIGCSFDFGGFNIGNCLGGNPYINYNLFSGAYNLASMNICNPTPCNKSLWSAIGLGIGTVVGSIGGRWISDAFSERKAEKAASIAAETKNSTDFYNALKGLGFKENVDILELTKDKIMKVGLTEAQTNAIANTTKAFGEARDKIDDSTTGLAAMKEEVNKTEASIAELISQLNENNAKEIQPKIENLNVKLEFQKKELEKLEALKKSCEEGGELYEAKEKAEQAQEDLKNYREIACDNLEKYQTQRRAEIYAQLDDADGNKGDRTKEKKVKWQYNSKGSIDFTGNNNRSVENWTDSDWRGLIYEFGNNRGTIVKQKAIQQFIEENFNDAIKGNPSITKALALIKNYKFTNET